MSNEVLWDPSDRFDKAIERLKTFTDPLAPVVARPTESHLQEFASVIENVIVPRLLMSHIHSNAETQSPKYHGSQDYREAQPSAYESQRAPAAVAKASPKVSLSSVAVQDFVVQTMLDDPDQAINHVRHLLDSGVQFQDILMELMAPAARVLGERWEKDTASFVEVALGVARMHRILRAFDGIPSHLWSKTGEGQHALLLPTPGEQHTFGLRLVQEFLMRDGWTVTNRNLNNLEELTNHIRSHHYDIVGLSLSGETLLDTFMSSIRVLKSESKNPQIKVLVGGHIFVERPELIETCGADGYAADAPETVKIVSRWAKRLSASV
jgi:MerR family transcriptional regulator, light-induced transcriptional regulator